MKKLEPFRFSPQAYKDELNQFRALLAERTELSEKGDVLPFFQRCRNLAAAAGSLNLTVGVYDRFAYEFRLSGSFVCDLVVGDSRRHAYTLVEFEDARPGSIFERVNRHYTCWGRRFECGFSQIVDWFWQIDGDRSSADFESDFGSRHAEFTALLVIGRSNHVDPVDLKRLRWRLDRVVIDSHKIRCLTFDDLYSELAEGWQFLEEIAKAERNLGRGDQQLGASDDQPST